MKTANIVSTVGHMCNIGQYCTIYIYILCAWDVRMI